jgi:hypothetical protein
MRASGFARWLRLSEVALMTPVRTAVTISPSQRDLVARPG